MPIVTTDQLFHLVKNLGKSEKRNFKIYARRNASSATAAFIELFDIIDKKRNYDESYIMDKLGLTKVSLINHKRHLYLQILKSLRLIHTGKEEDIRIREQLDFARILYGKGLYLQALKLLDRTKLMCHKASQDLLLLETLEFEKLIENRHITRSRKVKDKVENLISESTKIKKIINTSSELMNLNLKVHGMYIRLGHVKNERDLFVVNDYFQSNMPSIDTNKLTFFEEVYLHQAHVWLNYTCLNFKMCYQYAQIWVKLFQQRPFMIEKDPDLYLRGMHYLLVSLFYLDRKDEYNEHYSVVEKFVKKNQTQLSPTSQLIVFIYAYNARLNYYILNNKYSSAKKLIPEIEDQIKSFSHVLDQHRELIFYYKIAWILFASGSYEYAIDYLNRILNRKKTRLREDLLAFTRLFLVICHFTLEHYTLVLNLLPAVKRLFDKIHYDSRVIDQVLGFLQRSSESGNIAAKEVSSLQSRLTKLKGDQFEVRAFLLFSFDKWITSMQQEKPIKSISE